MALCSSVLTTPLASLNSPTTSAWYQFPIEGELWFQESLLHFMYWNPPCDLKELDGIHSHKASTLMAQHLLAAAYRYGLEFSSPYLDLPPYKVMVATLRCEDC